MHSPYTNKTWKKNSIWINDLLDWCVLEQLSVAKEASAPTLSWLTQKELAQPFLQSKVSQVSLENGCNCTAWIRNSWWWITKWLWLMKQLLLSMKEFLLIHDTHRLDIRTLSLLCSRFIPISCFLFEKNSLCGFLFGFKSSLFIRVSSSASPPTATAQGCTSCFPSTEGLMFCAPHHLICQYILVYFKNSQRDLLGFFQ